MPLMERGRVPNCHECLPPEHRVYTVLNLKNNCFSTPLMQVRQPTFIFEWTDLMSKEMSQPIWTRLPQGFKNPPTLFGEALQKDVTEFRVSHPNSTVLQYVDDILWQQPMLLPVRNSQRTCSSCSRRFISEERLSSAKVSYLEYKPTQGSRTLGAARMEADLQILGLQTKKQEQDSRGHGDITGSEFLGLLKNPRPCILSLCRDQPLKQRNKLSES